MVNVSQQAVDFARQLITFDGIYDINADNLIYSDGEPIAVAYKDKKLPVMLINNNMTVGDWGILNPYIETQSTSKERVWFFNRLRTIPGMYLKQLMIKTVEVILSEKTDGSDENTDFGALPLVAPFMANVDKTMIDEIQNFTVKDILVYQYKPRERLAYTKSMVLEADFKDEEIKGKKVRKKTFQVMQEMISHFLKTDDLTVYQCKPKNVALQEFDASVNLLIMLLDTLSEAIKLLLDEDVETIVCDFRDHMENLAKYHEKWAWCTSSSVEIEAKKQAKRDTKAKEAAESAPPWSNDVVTSQIPQQQVVTQQMVAPSAPASGIPAWKNEAALQQQPMLVPNLNVMPMYTPTQQLMPPVGYVPQQMIAPTSSIAGLPVQTSMVQPAWQGVSTSWSQPTIQVTVPPQHRNPYA